MKVVDPQGRTIRVRRRWWPWRRRAKILDVGDGGPDLMGADDLPGVVLAIVLALLFPIVLALAPILGELLLLLLLLPVAVLVRVLFGKPWTVEAVSDRGLLWQERVRGWNASGVRVLEVAGMYERGQGPVPVPVVEETA